MTAVRALRGVLAFLGVLSGTALAAPFAVELGGTRVGLDSPPGFSDTTFTGSPRLQELAETLTAASNRILMFAISDADLRKFTQGDTPDFRRYMLAATPRGLEHEHVTRAAFSTFVTDSLRDLGAAPGKDADWIKHLEKQPAGQPNLLAELRRDPEIVSVLQGYRLPPAQGSREAPRYLAASNTLMLLRGKTLSFTAFTALDGMQDIEWLRTTTARWIEQIQRINGR
jgi:hypothetical protein